MTASGTAQETRSPIEELAALLGKERLLLELLLFKLVSLRQLLAAGEVRFLPWAAEEVDRATEKLRSAELRRVVALEQVKDLPAEAGLGPGGPTLQLLAEHAPEPWRTIFGDHRRAFLGLTAEIEQALAAARRLATAGGATVSAALDRLAGATGTGETVTATTYGPGARWEPATAAPRFSRTI